VAASGGLVVALPIETGMLAGTKKASMCRAFSSLRRHRLTSRTPSISATKSAGAAEAPGDRNALRSQGDCTAPAQHTGGARHSISGPDLRHFGRPAAERSV